MLFPQSTEEQHEGYTIIQPFVRDEGIQAQYLTEMLAMFASHSLMQWEPKEEAFYAIAQYYGGTK